MLFFIMSDQALMLGPGYAPFIHTGEINSTGKPSRRQRHTDTFGLWGCVDGMLEVVDGVGAEVQRLAGPVVVFIAPAPGRIVATTPGSRWYYLRFDVVDRPRRRLDKRRAWCHSAPVTQPSPQAIWDSTPPTVVPANLCAGALQLLRDCCAQWWRNDHLHVQCNAILGLWLMEYVNHSRRNPITGSAGGGDLLQRCRDLIDERLAHGVDATDLAAACGYSRVHFDRRFRAETGMLPGFFIREERMARGRHLLANTDKPLSFVAEHCGYRSVAAFSRAFTRIHARTPGDWRRRLR